MPFRSKAQQRWAFATKQKFAEKWAKETGTTSNFKRLPEHVRARKKASPKKKS